MEDLLNIQTNFKQDIIEIIRKNKGIKKYKIKEEVCIQNNDVISNLFEKQFKELVKEGILIKKDKDKYKLAIEDFFVAKIYFNSQGNGFLTNIKDPEEKDTFVYKKDTLNSMHEDIVLAVKTKPATDKKRAEAKVVSVLERSVNKIVGTFMQYDDCAFVLPDSDKLNKDVYIPEKFKNNAKSYDKVIVKIIRYPSYKKNKDGTISFFKAEGEITEILGVSGEKGVDSLSIIKANNIREEFSTEVKKEASQINLIIKNEDKENRLDLRDKVIYTIDGEDAKDLDDSIHLEKVGDYYELGVHIADVAHYVKENGAIDKEALLRGNSIYLIDQVIPMLPKTLSNNVCSLNPNEEKLTLSCIMKINKDGNVVNAKIQESIIISKARLTYTDVTKYLEEGNEDFEAKFGKDVSNSLILAKELALILNQKRKNRGSVEFDTPETKFILDDNGKVVEIKPYERGIANNLIEEFMLLANETVAEKFAKLKIPFIYRCHENPRSERLELFDRIAKNCDLETNFSENENLTSKDLQLFLEENKDSENIEVLKILLLQSMQQAKYSPKCSAHFGLAAEYYSHFTSPIRRYPDLQIHRIIKDSLHGNINKITKLKYEKATEEVSEYCSKTERIAEQAERELNKIKMYEYILENKETIYDGYIRNFNKVGFFVTLDNTAEGFVKSSSYEFDDETYTCIVNGKTYKLGDKLKLKLKNVNNTREIVLDIIEE